MSKESVKRVEEYIARRKKSRGIDVQHIHGFDVGPDCGVELLLSDIEAILSAAAPQVVADERAKLYAVAIKATEDWVSAEYLSTRSIGRGGPDLSDGVSKAEVRARNAISALAAAPVQAQEPIGEVAAQGRFTSNVDWFSGYMPPIGTKLYTAPVQPVAVPDSGNDTALVNKDSIIRFGASLVGHASTTDAMDEDEVITWVKSQYDEWFPAIAAPAAQGDALSTLLDNMFSIEVRPFDVSIVEMGDEGWEVLATEPWHKNGPSLKKAAAKAIERAIAAKAAS